MIWHYCVDYAKLPGNLPSLAIIIMSKIGEETEIFSYFENLYKTDVGLQQSINLHEGMIIFSILWLQNLLTSHFRARAFHDLRIFRLG